MRHDVLRTTLLAAILASLAGCATTAPPEEPSQQSAARNQSSLSNKGLANLNLAQNYLKAGKLDIAMDRAERAYRSDPGSADVQVILGMIRERLGDDERAGDHYARALKLAPEQGHVLNVQGVWLCGHGQPDTADAMFAKAARDPFYTAKDQALFNGGKCAMFAGDLDKAEKYFRQGLEEAPENATLLTEMARLQYQKGNYLGARAFVQRRESLGGATADVLDLAARIEDGAGDAAAAARYRNRLNQQFPDYTPPTREGSGQP